ncbi:hypothetical protein RHOSPDRAFT_32342 [Rhodotorula sp. JG-1b]|nr:hypothetical protein RHOSPDRAFT_32342 [Rhodotorula sp. JG-1b]
MQATRSESDRGWMMRGRGGASEYSEAPLGPRQPHYTPAPNLAPASAQPPLSSGSAPPPPDSKPKQRSATSEFYRALVPSMLHCLALGSIVYYALELAYIYLAREKEGETLRARVEQLEGELAVARAGGADGTATELEGERSRKSLWKLW